MKGGSITSFLSKHYECDREIKKKDIQEQLEVKYESEQTTVMEDLKSLHLRRQEHLRVSSAVYVYLSQDLRGPGRKAQQVPGMPRLYIQQDL